MGQSRHRRLPWQATFQQSQLKLKQTIKPGCWHSVAGPCGSRGRTEVPEDRVSASSLLHPPQPPWSLVGISCLAPHPAAPGTPHPSPVLSGSSFLPGRSWQVPDFFSPHFLLGGRRQGRLGGPAPQRHRQPLSLPRRLLEPPRWSWGTSRSLCTVPAPRHQGAARRAWWGWCMASCGWCSPMPCP